MAQRSRPTLMKREREKARVERQKMKEARTHTSGAEEEKRRIKAELEKVMLDGDYRRSSREKLTKTLNSHGILDDAKQYARAYAAQARKSIDVLPQSEYRSCLMDILSFVIERNI